MKVTAVSVACLVLSLSSLVSGHLTYFGVQQQTASDNVLESIANKDLLPSLPTNFDYAKFACVSCRYVVEQFHGGHELEICHKLPGVCNFIGLDAARGYKGPAVHESSLKYCQEHTRFCTPADKVAKSAWKQHHSKMQAQKLQLTSGMDVRVTKAYGSKGYDKIRVSVISNVTHPVTDDEFFTYQAPFQYKWTDKFLSSRELDVHEGENVISFAGNNVTYYHVPKNMPTRGIMIGDPCFYDLNLICEFGEKYQTYQKLTTLINLLAEDSTFSYYQILGDNFYDLTGKLGSMWMDSISPKAQSKIFGTVIGNHDINILGNPALHLPWDQWGNGFMQFYAMDSRTSVKNSTSGFIDFSVNPESKTLPVVDNFFWYWMIGNQAFIGYSGAHAYTETLPAFQEVCLWLKEQNPAVAFLTGHWNKVNDGCQEEMDVPDVLTELAKLPGCAEMGKRLKYVMGHVHSNLVTLPDQGFMVGGNGMEGTGEFGLPIFDTYNDRVLISYFPLNDKTGLDNYAVVHKCFADNGYENCLHLSTTWLNATFAELREL